MSSQPLNLYDVDDYTASKKGQVVANYAAGRGTNIHSIQLEDVHDVLENAMIRVRKILERVVELDGH